MRPSYHCALFRRKDLDVGIEPRTVGFIKIKSISQVFDPLIGIILDSFYDINSAKYKNILNKS